MLCDAGNLFDVSSYVVLSEISDVFTPTDVFAYKRSIEISMSDEISKSSNHRSEDCMSYSRRIYIS